MFEYEVRQESVFQTDRQQKQWSTHTQKALIEYLKRYFSESLRN